MAAQKSPSRASAIVTLVFFLIIIGGVVWGAVYLSGGTKSNDSTAAPTPTPTPEPGVYNIDEQLDMLN